MSGKHELLRQLFRQLADQNPANSPNEIKLGATTLIDKGVRPLSALASKLDPAELPAPPFLMVLFADGDIAYRRPDGIIVCSFAARKP